MKTKFGAALIAAAMSLTLISSPAAAEPTAKDLLALIDKGGIYETTGTFALQSYYQAYLWANAYVEMQTEKKGHIYCPPSTLILQAEQTRSIVEQYLKANPENAGKPAGLVVMLALQETFVCN